MPGNPIDSVYVDVAEVSKADVRDFSKTRNRQRVESHDEIRDRDWSGQFAGLQFKAEIWDIDTADATSPDDDDSTIVDSAGNRWKRQIARSLPTKRPVTVLAGPLNIGDDWEDIIEVKNQTGADLIVNWPSAEDRKSALRIIDAGFNAGSHKLIMTPAAGEKIMGGNSYSIDSDGASFEATPLSDGSGWA